jgi:hypothetical protein
MAPGSLDIPTRLSWSMVGGRRLSLRSWAVLVYTAGAPRLCRVARRTKKRPALAHIRRYTCICKPLDSSCPRLVGDVEHSTDAASDANGASTVQSLTRQALSVASRNKDGSLAGAMLSLAR